MKTITILKKARKIIEKSENWIQGTWQLGNRFCAVGSIAETTGIKNGGDIIHSPAYIALRKHTKPKNRAVGWYNDTHSHKQVLALFDKAIASEKKTND